MLVICEYVNKDRRSKAVKMMKGIHVSLSVSLKVETSVELL